MSAGRNVDLNNAAAEDHQTSPKGQAIKIGIENHNLAGAGINDTLIIAGVDRRLYAGRLDHVGRDRHQDVLYYAHERLVEVRTKLRKFDVKQNLSFRPPLWVTMEG